MEYPNEIDNNKNPKRKTPHIPETPNPPNKRKKVDEYDSDDDDDDDGNKLLMILFPPMRNGNVPYNQNNNQTIIKPDNTCRNPHCDHKTLEEDSTPIIIPSISEIKDISDLIMLGKSYHCKKNTEFVGMNLRLLYNLIQPLTELYNMIGMTNVKESMVEQILFFLQGNHNNSKCGKCTECSFNLPCTNTNTEMLHTVITGPPGVGKTELGKILGKVYKELEILSTGAFKLVSRSDLIAGYLGQTAMKTQKVIDECKGGVLFIDEAYSLGNSELRDSFSKECIDTLNKNLSENRDFLCIIAGYNDELEKCFFKYNDGLKRRFTFRYDIKPYSYDELLRIFEFKVSSLGWKLCYYLEPSDCQDIINRKHEMRQYIENLFKKNSKNFPNYGGDIETYFLKCKICHNRRCVFKQDEKRKTLSIDDIEKGLQVFLKHRKGEKNTIEYYSDIY